VEAVEVVRFGRRVVGVAAKAGPLLAEDEELLAKLQRLMFQTQMEEYTVRAHARPEYLKLRRQHDCRTRTTRALFGTMVVGYPADQHLPCSKTVVFVDLSCARFVQRLPDRCTPEQKARAVR